MKSKCVLFLILLLAAAARGAPAQGLRVGDAPPPIWVAQWVKGERVDRFDRGTIYVVVFWATWSRQSREAIPLLAELQSKFKDYRVQFVGVNVWEQNPEGVAAWVKANGEQLNFPLAVDHEAGMRCTWVEASGRRAVPSAFIIRDGKVAWFGPPDELGATLESMMPKEYHQAARKQQRREKILLERKFWALSRKVKPLVASADIGEAVAAIDKAIAEDPTLEPVAGPLKYRTLVEGRRWKDASSYGRTLVETTLKDDVEALYELASWIVDRPGTRARATRDLKLACDAAERANELAASENPGVLDILAEIYAEAGAIDFALEAQEEAVRLTGRKNPRMIERLQKYRAQKHAPK